MSEFTIRSNEVASGPIIVPAAELFEPERLQHALEDPAPRVALLPIVDAAERKVEPYRLLAPGKTSVRHTPTVTYNSGRDGRPQYRITAFKYDTQEAYETTELRGQDGQTLLAAIENYRGEPFDANATVLETFCVDRQYTAFIRREEVRSGRYVVATMPAGWNDVTAVMDSLDDKIPSAPRELITKAEAPKVEVARQQIDRFKATLSSMPEFRRAIVDRLSDRPYLEEVPADVEAQLVDAFWEGKVLQPSDDPDGSGKQSRLEINMGGHNIVLSHQKQAVYAEAPGEDGTVAGVVMVEEFDLTIENIPEIGNTYEVVLSTTKPHPHHSNVVFNQRKREADYNNALVKSLASEYNSMEEILAKADEVHELLLLPPSETSKELIQKMLAIELIGAALTDNEWQPDNLTEEQVDRLETQLAPMHESLEGLSKPDIAYPGVDDVYQPAKPSSPRSIIERAPQPTQKLHRLRRILRRLPFFGFGDKS